ncbi:MAG: hypothetical protein Q8908_09960 [Bacteroidota bacterium]|nr:hypothetical protein [Bacteroidota bacterium]
MADLSNHSFLFPVRIGAAFKPEPRNPKILRRSGLKSLNNVFRFGKEPHGQGHMFAVSMPYFCQMTVYGVNAALIRQTIGLFLA